MPWRTVEKLLEPSACRRTSSSETQSAYPQYEMQDGVKKGGRGGAWRREVPLLGSTGLGEAASQFALLRAPSGRWQPKLEKVTAGPHPHKEVGSGGVLWVFLPPTLTC